MDSTPVSPTNHCIIAPPRLCAGSEPSGLRSPALVWVWGAKMGPTKKLRGGQSLNLRPNVSVNGGSWKFCHCLVSSLTPLPSPRPTFIGLSRVFTKWRPPLRPRHPPMVGLSPLAGKSQKTFWREQESGLNTGILSHRKYCDPLKMTFLWKIPPENTVKRKILRNPVFFCFWALKKIPVRTGIANLDGRGCNLVRC